MTYFSPDVVVLFVILGAIAAVAMAYSMARYCMPGSFELGRHFPEPPDEQKVYMRQVRVRNQEGLWADAREGRGGRGKGRMMGYGEGSGEGSWGGV
ncbi:hypothetical protein ACLMJK_006273 [Lecanora helva]